MSTKLTLIGMNNYDNTLFDTLTIPSGPSKQTVVNTILLEYGEMEVLYSDLDFMKFAIGIWSANHQWQMKKAWDAINTEYDPLYNYDRTETHTETPNIIKSTTASGTNSETSSVSGTSGRSVEFDGTETTSGNSTVTDNGTTSSERKVSAFDASTYSPENSESGTSSNTQGTTASTTKTTSEDTTESDTTSSQESRSGQTSGTNTETETGTRTTAIRAFGNIGVTTSQQMLTDEIDLARYNYYKDIACQFAQDLLIMTY